MQLRHDDFDRHVERLWKEGRLWERKHKDVRIKKAEIFTASGSDPAKADAALTEAENCATESILGYTLKILKNGNGNGHGNKDTLQVVAESHESLDNQQREASIPSNFVLVNRALRRHPFLRQCPHWVRLFWLNLILDAAYTDHDMEWLDGMVHLKRGQWVITERRVALEYEISPRMVHYWLNNLELEGMIRCENLSRPAKVEPKFYVTGCVTGFVTGTVTGGVLVTLCNYNKFQPEKNVNVTRNVTSDVTACVAHSNNGFKEGKERRVGLYAQPNGGAFPRTPPKSRKAAEKFTPEVFLEIFNTNRGRLNEVQCLTTKTTPQVVNLIDVLIEREGSEDAAMAKWTAVVCAANRCHPANSYVDFWFLVGDDDKYMRVLGGKYDREYEVNGRTASDKARERRRRGGFEGHTAEDGSGSGERPKVGIVIGPAPKVR